MDKFDNIYRIESARYKNWDYGSNAFYFVTICTHGREYFFGKIENSIMVLNEIGEIVVSIWNEIPVQFSFVRLGEFIIMPNHVHGIIQINKLDKTIYSGDVSRDAINRVSTEEGFASKLKGGITGSHNPMLHQNLSRILRWVKGRATFEARKINPDFSWQSRFHDRIIRDKNEWYAKTNYIKNNPKNWRDDEFNIDGL